MSNRVHPSAETICKEQHHEEVAGLMKGEFEEFDILKDYRHDPNCGYDKCPLKFFPDELAGASCLFLMVALGFDITLVDPKELTNDCSIPVANDDYRGLTSFHLAVAFGNLDLVKKMISANDAQNFRLDLLTLMADGRKLNGTIFMGKFPCFIAACLNKIDVVEYFVELEDESVLFKGTKHTSKDNIFHSMVRFSNCFPNKVPGVLKMLDYLIGKHCEMEYRGARLEIPKTRNSENKTALQLSAEYGLADIFHLLMDAHSHVTLYDLTHERRSYDITDVDKSALLYWKKSTEQETEHDSAMSQQSVCESLCRQPLNIVVKMIDNEAILEIIRVKWVDCNYRSIAVVLGILHMLVISGVLLFAYDRSNLTPWLSSKARFVTSGIFGSIAVCYLFVEIGIRRGIAKQPFNLTPHHNVVYRVAAILFGLCLVLDSAIYMTSSMDSWFLSLSVIPGTWYIFCYLRCLPILGFGGYVVLINESIFFGLIPVASIIFIKFLVNTAVLYFRLRNSTDQNVSTHFRSFGSSLLAMFRLMTTLADLDGLESTVESYFTIIFYVFFVTTVGIFLMNALISILTNQFRPNFEHRSEILYLQKLSLIVFIDGILAITTPLKVLGCPGTFQREGETNNPPFLNRVVMSFRKVRFHEYEHPPDIEHDRLNQFEGDQSGVGQNTKLDKRLDDVQKHFEGIKKFLDGEDMNEQFVATMKKLFDDEDETSIQKQFKDILQKQFEDMLPKQFKVIDERFTVMQRLLHDIDTAVDGVRQRQAELDKRLGRRE